MKHLCCSLLLAAALAQAQARPAAPRKIGNVLFQGSVRTRVESWGWFGAGPESDYVFSGTQVRLGFSQNRGAWDWNFELAAPILAGLPADAILAGAPGQLGAGASYYAANRRRRTTAMVFPKQAFVRWKGILGNEAHTIRAGRFEFSDGAEVAPKDPTLAAIKAQRIAQRLLGPFGFTHVMRSFDGLHYSYGRGKNNGTVVGAVPTRGVFQVDGWGPLATAFGYAAWTRQLPGAKQNAEWRLFGLYFHDWRNIVKTDNRPLASRQRDLADIRLGASGGHMMLARRTTAGTFDGMLWGILQRGRWGAQQHRGHSGLAEAGWQPAIPVRRLAALRPWIRAGYSASSGDRNPNDNRHETFFQYLPTPRPFARFPFFNMMNNRDAMGSLALRPNKTVVLKSEYHSLHLAAAQDQWLLGGGAFQPWTFGYAGRPSFNNRGLASLTDLSLDWNRSASVSLSFYYGFARGRAVIQAIHPSDPNGSLGYVEMTYRF